MSILSKPFWDLENASVECGQTPKNTLAKVVEAVKAFGCRVEENSIYAIVAHRSRISSDFESVLTVSNLVDYVWLKEGDIHLRIPKQESDRRIHDKFRFYIKWGNAFKYNLPWDSDILLPPPSSIAIVVVSGDGGYATYMNRLKELGYKVLLIYPRYRTKEDLVFASTNALVYEDLFVGPPVWTSPEKQCPLNYGRKSINPKFLLCGGIVPSLPGDGNDGTGGSGGSGSGSVSTGSRSRSGTGSRNTSGTGSRNTSGTGSRNTSGTTGYRRATGQCHANMKQLPVITAKIKRILEGEPKFDFRDATNLYTLIYNLCIQKSPDDYLEKLYSKYRETIEDYCKQTVMYVEMGMGHMDKYEDDFESSMLQDTESYYSSKASSWIEEYSCPAYMLKAEECLEKERERVTHYLRKRTKLLEKVENELVAKQLIENERSGYPALLRDAEMNDLSRMYHKFPQGLDAVADFYKQHATAEAIVIFKQFKEKATNPQVLLYKTNELYDKCMVCHTEWSNVEVVIGKMKRILLGEPELKFDFQDYADLYTIIYDMCVQKSPHEYTENLYNRYRQTIEDYCKQTVLRSLRKKQDENFLDEFALRWSNHECLVRWLSHDFSYLDRYYTVRRYLPTLDQVGLTCFHDLIHKEREGEEIDRALLKNILEMYVEMGMGQMDKYEDDFESSMLQDTESYYSSKASSWIKEDSCPEYMLKAEECLEKERERVTHYLHKSTEPKLLEKVENELLVVVAKQLVENEHSGCRALLRDGEVLYGDCVGYKTKVKFFNEAMDKPLKIFNNMPLAGF